MKYAKFSIGHGTEHITSEEMAKYSDLPRLSEWVEIDFPPRAPEELVPEQLAALDQQEMLLRGAFQKEMDKLKERRANLLALTNKVAS